jgi:hypothetical protein
MHRYARLYSGDLIDSADTVLYPAILSNEKSGGAASFSIKFRDETYNALNLYVFLLWEQSFIFSANPEFKENGSARNPFIKGLQIAWNSRFPFKVISWQKINFMN